MFNLSIKVLSLQDAFERRQRFDQTFKEHSNLKYVFFDGIYGKNIDKQKLECIYSSEKANKNIGRDLTLGEIGATYSHFLMYEESLKNNDDFLLVLEDDSYIDANFDDVLFNLLQAVKPTDDSIIFIQEHTLNSNVILSKKDVKLNNHYNLSRLLGSSQYFVGSYGYIITRAALKKITRNYLPIYCVCDHWYFIKKDSKIANFSCVIPSLVITNEEDVRVKDSYINADRSKVIKKRRLTRIALLKIAIKRVVLRFINKDWE